MKTFKRDQQRFLTISRYALGLPERRKGPDRGEGARGRRGYESEESPVQLRPCADAVRAMMGVPPEK